MGQTLNRRRLMGVGVSLLPSGYTQLDYIENTSNAYIDTGIIGSSPIKAEIDMMSISTPSDASFLGSRNGTGRFYVLHYYNGVCIGYGNFSSAGLIKNGMRYKINIILTNGEQGISYGSDYYPFNFMSNNGDVNTELNLYIFTQNYYGRPANFWLSRLYELKLYRSDQLVFHCIPCIDPNNVVGVYDLVGGQFLSSPNGTTFVAGNPV